MQAQEKSHVILDLQPNSGVKVRVLIVEDDKSLADGLLRTLRQSGYAVDHAPNGELALRACSEEHYDLIVLDVSLPGIDGFEVTSRLRHLGLYVPVLIFGLSASQANAAPGLTLASLSILGAIALVSLVVSPLASAAALRSYLK